MKTIHPVAVLMLLVLVLLPFGRLSELPVIIMAVWGLGTLIWQQSQLLSQTSFRLFTGVFLAYFVMISVSALDSYWPEKTWLIALGSWRFYLAGVLVLVVANQHGFKNQVLWGASVLALIWSLDALFQAATGFDLLGLQSYPGRLTGVFGGNVKLGPVLTLLLPLVLIWVGRFPAWLRWLIVALVLWVILLSGTRSAWLMAGFVLFMYWLQHVQGRRWLLLLKTTLVAAVAVGLLWFFSADFQQRVDRSMQIFTGQSEAIDFALADRLPIWVAAIDAFEDHPINGVGARAFREVYANYAPENGQVGQGMSLHAHHWVLEILAETGLVGLLVMTGILVTMFRMTRSHIKDPQVWPYAVALMAALLPIVSLYSLFASFWSICLWWLMLMLFAGVKRD